MDLGRGKKKDTNFWNFELLQKASENESKTKEFPSASFEATCARLGCVDQDLDFFWCPKHNFRLLHFHSLGS